jgi:phage terminase large subunit GpA-like protein
MGVFPLQGRDNESTARKMAEFGTFETAIGTQAWWVSVGRYKDRLAGALKKDWSGLGHQPKNQPNFPADFPDKFFKELTKEKKREVKDAHGTTKKFEWYRPGNADNHAWDISVYNIAAREIVAWDTCTNVLGLTEGIDWPEFNRLCDEDNFFRTLTDGA